MNPRSLLFTGLLALACWGAHAQAVKDRRGAVLGDRAALEHDARWIYNDWQQGFAEAKRTGKPLLVTLRCVPCLACAGIDARVLMQNAELGPVLDRFVCVRVMNANALDLALFQVDYDLSFSAVFFNADGTVYGRFGSWAHQVDSKNGAVDGFRAALEGALALHANYPANRAALAGKQGGELAFKDPLQIPALAGKYTRNLDWEGKVVQSCVHCHQIGDSLRTYHRERKERIPDDLIYPWPAPATVGFELTAEKTLSLRTVAAGSPADRAGLRPGDELLAAAGQPVVSEADVSWVLHRFAENGGLPLTVKRAGAPWTVRLDLPAGWRTKADISRRVGTWEMRAMALGGLLLEDLPDDQRTARGLAPDALALRVKHAGEYGQHAAAKRSGFQKDDVIVELDGARTRTTESEVIGRLLRTHRAGETVPAVVLRGTERKPLSLPMQ